MRNWMENNQESSSRSAPDSPIMGLLKGSSDAATQKVSAFGEAKEDAPGAEKSAPSLANTERSFPSAPTADADCNTRFIKGHKPSNHIRARIKSHVYTIE